MRRFRRRGLFAACVSALGFFSFNADALGLRVQVAQHGDFVVVGNSLAQDCAVGVPAPLVGVVGPCGTNTQDSAPDLYWRTDTPIPGLATADLSFGPNEAQSAVMLDLPSGASVTHAYLYWASRLPLMETDTSVQLGRPGGFLQSVVADQSFDTVIGAHQAVADITSLVQAEGPGLYRIEGVHSFSLADLLIEDTFSAFWMVVFYERASEPIRVLSLFDGLDAVSNGVSSTVLMSGFSLSPGGGRSKVALVAFGGDEKLGGDSVVEDDQLLAYAINPAYNFFNGTRSAFGAATSNVYDMPRLSGTPRSMSGMDLDVVDISRYLKAGATDTTFVAKTINDDFFLGGIVASIPLSAGQDLSGSTKSVVDVNGGAVLPGDLLTYTMDIKNSGILASTDTQLVDPLPPGTTFVPGSIEIVNGPNAGLKTDATSDDQAEYQAATRKVVVRLGDGANAAAGGSFIPGASSEVRFSVVVDAGSVGVIKNQATVLAGGLPGVSAISTPTDGNGPGPLAPATVVVVAGCLSDADCASPKPFCNLAANPSTCVECRTNTDCTSAPYTACDQTSSSCLCVSLGVELCNGIDDTCDAEVDEGNPEPGSCTAQFPEGCMPGVTSCSEGTLQCIAIGNTFNKEAPNGVDDDCDGFIDDCYNDIDCIPGTYCDGSGVCREPKAFGKACQLLTDCRNPPCLVCGPFFCVDGFCCDTQCSGICEACDGTEPGVCAPIVGEPHGDRDACPTSGETCDAAFCDGQTTQICAGLPSAGQVCAVACEMGQGVAFGTCDGDGLCVPSSVLACTATPCKTVEDCTEPLVCDFITNTCVSPTTFETPQDPGCGCKIHRETSSRSFAGFFVLFLVACIRRRDAAS